MTLDEITAHIRTGWPQGLHTGPAPAIGCADGFTLSVQASEWTYCEPRDNTGPWSRVEVGFPSEPEPLLMEWCEDPGRPTETVYGYVPIEVVQQVILKHGGRA